jgi:hypothetical protein
MKRTLLIIAIATIACSGFAQNTKKDSLRKDDGIKTIFGNKKISHGGYGAFTIGYSQIDGKDAFITGGRGAWVIGHSFALGIGGSGFANDMYFDNSPGSQEYSLEGGYGGLVLEPILLPKFPVHLSFPCLIGAGGVAYIHSTYNDNFDSDMYVEASNAFLVAEPTVELEINLLRFVRLALSASYRFTTPTHIINKPNDVLNGYNYGFTLKFGKF